MKQPYLWKVWFETDDLLKWDYLVIYAPNEEKALEEAEKVKPDTKFHEVYEAVDCYGFDLKDVIDNIQNSLSSNGG